MRPKSPLHVLKLLGLKNLYLKPLRFIYLLGFLLIVFLIYQLVLGDRFSFKTIHCTIDNQACSSELVAKLDYLKDQKVFTFKPSLAKEKLIKTNPYFKNVNFQIFYPDKLNVQIETEKDLIKVGLIKYTVISPTPTPTPLLTPESTIAAIATPSATHDFLNHLPFLSSQPFDYYLLTSHGDLITADESSSIDQAQILIEDNLPATATLQNFYLLYHELKLSGFLPRNIWVFGRAAGLKLEKDSIVVFDLNIDPRRSVASLQQIRSESTIDFDVSLIDLRFKNPVIRKLETNNDF